MITRDLEQIIENQIGTQRVIVIYGARQVGKTTLLKAVFGGRKDVLWLNGDNDSTQERMRIASPESLGKMIGNYKIVVIDEAQRIENIGLKLKILFDNFGDKVQFVATGSSSFDLANKINEPLTGRKWTYLLPTLSANELVNSTDYVEEMANLSDRLVYGSYPAVVEPKGGAREKILAELTTDNLYKDVLDMGDIIKTDKLRKILQALAFQVGNQVSMTELASLVDIDRKTIDKYISLLEQAFIIYRLPSFSRNLRNELKTTQKIYFCDNGVRNVIINDLRPVTLRNDVGALFENYIISEYRKKYPNKNLYFWRNTDQREIDLVSEINGGLDAIEIKYNSNKKVKFPDAFVNEYRPTKQLVINSENYLDELVNN